MFEINDYREIIKKEFLQICKNKSSFTQKDFANLLEISTTQLSQMLSGKRGLSKNSAIKISKNLGFNKKETIHFLNLVMLSDSRNKIEKENAFISTQNHTGEINNNTFAIVSDWYHFAILELTYIKTFSFTVSNISQRLKISEVEVEQAISRLMRADLLEKTEQGEYRAKEDTTFTSENIPSDAIKKAHHQFIQKASRALVTQNVNERSFHSVVMSIDSQKMPEAQERLRLFKESFINDFGLKDSENKDSIYAMTMQFFCLDK